MLRQEVLQDLTDLAALAKDERMRLVRDNVKFAVGQGSVHLLGKGNRENLIFLTMNDTHR